MPSKTTFQRHIDEINIKPKTNGDMNIFKAIEDIRLSLPGEGEELFLYSGGQLLNDTQSIGYVIRNTIPRLDLNIKGKPENYTGLKKVSVILPPSAVDSPRYAWVHIFPENFEDEEFINDIKNIMIKSRNLSNETNYMSNEIEQKVEKLDLEYSDILKVEEIEGVVCKIIRNERNRSNRLSEYALKLNKIKNDGIIICEITGFRYDMLPEFLQEYFLEKPRMIFNVTHNNPIGQRSPLGEFTNISELEIVFSLTPHILKDEGFSKEDIRKWFAEISEKLSLVCRN